MKAMLAPGTIAMPNGCEARGSASVRLIASDAGSITLTEAACLLTTHNMPLLARAIERGAVPTVISRTLARVTASNTVTESLSWLTTHSRALPLVRGSYASVDEPVGRCAV